MVCSICSLFTQIMLPLCGAGARLSLARALCEAAASIGQFNSHTVLCASMAVKLLCYVRDEISGQEKWFDEIPRSLLSGALVQAVALFPLPKYSLALGLSYHHYLSVGLLEGNNINIEEVKRSNDYNRRISSNTASCCNVVEVLFKARLRERSVSYMSGMQMDPFFATCPSFNIVLPNTTTIYHSLISHHFSGVKEVNVQ